MDVGELCVGQVVVTLQAVPEIVAIISDLVDYGPRLLHYCATMLKRPGYLFSRSFQGAIESERLCRCGTAVIARFNTANPGVGAIPLLWPIKDLFRASIGFCYVTELFPLSRFPEHYERRFRLRRLFDAADNRINAISPAS